MKRLFVVVVVSLVLLSACGAKGKKQEKTSAQTEEKYLFTGNNHEFVASVVSEFDKDGNECWYFALGNYRLIRKSKEDAVSYFNDFKERWERDEKEFGEGAGGRILMLERERLELLTVGSKTIYYVDLDATPNYAVPEM